MSIKALFEAPWNSDQIPWMVFVGPPAPWRPALRLRLEVQELRGAEPAHSHWDSWDSRWNWGAGNWENFIWKTWERLKERLKDMKSGNNLWFIEIEIGFGWFGDEHSSRFDIFIGYLAASHMEIWGWVTNNFMGIPVQWDITNYVWCIRCSGLSDFDGW